MKINVISIVDSRNELVEIMRRRKSKKMILLGKDSTADAFIGLFECTKEGTVGLEVGIISDSAQPNMQWFAFEDSVWFGYNDRVEIIDYNTGAAVKIENGYGAFYSFHKETTFVVAFFETAVVCISKNQDIAWEYFVDDVISGFYLENEKIYINTFEEKSLVLNLTTGKEII